MSKRHSSGSFSFSSFDPRRVLLVFFFFLMPLFDLLSQFLQQPVSAARDAVSVGSDAPVSEAIFSHTTAKHHGRRHASPRHKRSHSAHHKSPPLPAQGIFNESCPSDQHMPECLQRLDTIKNGGFKVKFEIHLHCDRVPYFSLLIFLPGCCFKCYRCLIR